MASIPGSLWDNEDYLCNFTELKLLARAALLDLPEALEDISSGVFTLSHGRTE